MRWGRYVKVTVVGTILFMLVVCGLAAPVLVPYDPQQQRLEAVSYTHLTLPTILRV